LEKNPYRRRIRVIVNILNNIIRRQDEIGRKDVVEMLRKSYEKHKLKPFKGKANPPDLYDKELVSLYVVGRYGLGLDEDYPSLFEKIFYIEKELEKAVDLIMSGRYEEARLVLKNISPSNVVDSNTVARMLRIPFTKLLFGFMSEEDFSKILLKTREALPEEEKTVKNYVKFYIAFKIAEAIYRGEARNRSYKEALKKALALRIGFPKTYPSDDYIALIAKDVFNVPDDVLEKTLSMEKK